MEFEKMGLKKDVLNALSNANLKNAFEVQETIVPLIFKGYNVIFTSRTGSGKTLTYLLGYVGKINKKLGLQMLVIVPTRELAIQVGKEMNTVCETLGINVGMLYGGREIKGDYRTLNKKNHILIATPGRLIMHVNEKRIKVGDVNYLVYDESDQMFDQGFYDDCAYIKKRVSNNAQIILSSATITSKVASFIEKEIVNFEFIMVGEIIPKNIVQEKIYCEKLEKNHLILELLKKKKFSKGIIFCNTKQKSTNISQFLNDNGYVAKAMNGSLDQKERINHLNLFKQGKIHFLVATDVASRGIHIQNVDLVINYDIPSRVEFYVHRIGRSGRLDSKGYSLALICPEDEEKFQNIEVEYQINVKDITKLKKNI